MPLKVGDFTFYRNPMTGEFIRGKIEQIDVYNQVEKEWVTVIPGRTIYVIKSEKYGSITVGEEFLLNK